MNWIKKISWIFSTIAITTIAFADDSNIANNCDPCPSKKPLECDPCHGSNKPYEKGYAVGEKDLPKAYVAPARIDICKGLDTFATGSFIYWQPLGSQLDVGVVQFFSADADRIKPIKFNTDYEPGFKVGLGTHFAHDDWHLYAQYTRLHETENEAFKPTPGVTGRFASIWYQIDPNSPTLFNLTDIPDGVKVSWKIELDKIDLELGRAFYLGTYLIATPFVGASGHLMKQSYISSLTDIRTTTGGGLYRVFYKNDSWSIGPRFGLDAKWIFYKGFRLFGYGAFSFMFSENDVSGNSIEANVRFTAEKVEKTILRQVEEIQLGFGWGSYFSSYKWHIDFSVAYEAQKYSHTNYMSYYSQQALATLNIKSADTFLHGLTVSARFDF